MLRNPPAKPDGDVRFAFQIKTNAAKAKSQSEREQVSALNPVSSAASWRGKRGEVTRDGT